MTDAAEPDWEAFYRDYRKPGFVPGYEILHKLGGGAFGIVFKARKESIGKNYAIKFLKLDEVGVRGAVMRELDSVRLFAQIDHPNLVTIEDKGEIHGIPFILMGYAGEETLRDRIDAGPMSREAALRILAQVGRGLQALHDRSLVHFDLKPGNVFLRGDIARLGDYGLSKLVSASHNSLSFGRGTPYYMAPELLEQRGDWRSDIYSLGVILFECLSGGVPFRGDSEWEILRQHETAEPEFPRSIPPREQAIIARCMRKDPAARYQSVAEILADLFGGAAPADGAHPIDAAAPAATPQPSPATLAALAAATALRRRPRRPAARWLFLAVLLVPLAWTFLAFQDRGFQARRFEARRSEARAFTNHTLQDPAFQDPAFQNRGRHSSTSVRGSGRSTVPPLQIPRSVEVELRVVRAILRDLRSQRIDPGQARRDLQSCPRATAIAGANELLALDYGRREDTGFAIELHQVLGALTHFRFRSRAAPPHGSIPARTAAYNRRTAEQFRQFVRSEYY